MVLRSDKEDVTRIDWEAVLVQNSELRAQNERLREALDQVRSIVRTGIPVDREDALAAWRRLETACQT